MTVWVSKGLQFPVVYLPFAFNRNVQDRELVLFHDGDHAVPAHRRERQPGLQRRRGSWAASEDASDDSRLTYVAMTRAQSQVVAWWAPSYDEPNGGLSRLLRGRRPGESAVPDRCVPDEDLRRRRDGAVPGVGGGGRAGASRSRWCAPVPRAAGRRAASRSRCAALPPRDRHRVAADVVLGADPRRRDDAG